MLCYPSFWILPSPSGAPRRIGTISPEAWRAYFNININFNLFHTHLPETTFAFSPRNDSIPMLIVKQSRNKARNLGCYLIMLLRGSTS